MPSADARRVLVVEDDEHVAAVHCRFVSQQPGFSVVARAATAGQAREFVRTLRPHLVLLDLELPGQNGLELLRELRSSSLPVEVIAVTAHSGPAVVRAAMQLGVIDYLVKPFLPGRLSEALVAFVARADELAREHALDQAAIDRLRAGVGEQARLGAASIRTERLAGIRDLLEHADVAMTADEVAAASGMARVTARRYLEHLVSLGQCTADTVPDGPGRPRKSYRLWPSDRVGG